jgi:Kef-type K+ transport system membrane component KefB
VEQHLISEIAICIIVAWICAVGAQVLRQPLILAYLLAGVAIGPVGIGWIKDQHSIETISDLGLILLLFMIGLEINLKNMLSAGRIITITSAVQIVGCCLAGIVFFRLCGFPLKTGALDAFYLAVASALSSTVIIVKLLYEKRELDSFAGRITLGVLVLQDLFAILFLAIQPQLKDPSLVLVGKSFFYVGVLVFIAFVASRFVLPPVFRAVARLPELVSVGALAWCFLIAGLANRLGLSREMGALVAGVAISTFPYALDVGAKVTSLRDFFITLFFVGLGMKIPLPTPIVVGWGVAIGAFVMISRFVTVFPPLYKMGAGYRAALLPAINLGQISELSLVIMTIGLNSGHISPQAIGTMAYAFAFLAVGSSYAISRSETLVFWFYPKLNKLGLRDLDQEEAPELKGEPKIYMLGFSWTASSLLEEITRREPAMLADIAILDFNPAVNKELRCRGIHAIYGDISQRDTLIHAGIEKAQIIICTIPNTVLKGTNNLRMLQQLRELNTTAQIIVHAELFSDVPQLYAAGASYVSLPRLIEAVNLCEVVQAARKRLLDEKNNELKRELLHRKEVIP